MSAQPAPLPTFQATLSQQEVFNIVSRCMPPRSPSKILLCTKLAGDAEDVLQEQGNTDQPLRRSSSTSYHGDGFIDAPSFVNATQPETLLTQGKAPPPMSAIGVDDWDTTTLEETCVAVDMVDASKGKTYPLDGSVSPELHTPVAAVGADGLGSSTSGPRVPRRMRRVIQPGVQQRSPFIDYNRKRTFNCIETMNKLYDVIFYWVRHIPGADVPVISPQIINYDGFYITLKESVHSMKPKQWLSSMVIEIGIFTQSRTYHQAQRRSSCH
ncbi:hypothetical protein D1007_03029 [Hordeum vulgare]|nr:hypothetical protein D1007_03029 [Hordeum vulgare]